MHAQQDVLDFFSELRSNRQIGYAKSYYWDYAVNNVRRPTAEDFGLPEITCKQIRNRIDAIVTPRG